MNHSLKRKYELTGGSAKMEKLRREVATLAGMQDTVLILGQRGTGKELVARALHDQGKRRGGPFALVDCSALSESVFESDLFGHERGSFTGAYKRKTGLLENAHEGTLFLDEIAHLSLPLQAKMLRFLEQRTIRRVGGRAYLHIDTRVVAATNRDLGMMVEEKTFLPDLYDRLNVLRVRTPDLAEHPEDIPDLIAHFAREENMKQRFGNMAPEVLEVLKAHPWPGNVRQLFNVLRRLAIRTGEGGLQKSEVLEALSY